MFVFQNTTTFLRLLYCDLVLIPFVTAISAANYGNHEQVQFNQITMASSARHPAIHILRTATPARDPPHSIRQTAFSIRHGQSGIPSTTKDTLVSISNQKSLKHIETKLKAEVTSQCMMTKACIGRKNAQGDF